MLMLATVLGAKGSKKIFGLEITVSKEMKSTSTKKTFRRVRVLKRTSILFVISPIPPLRKKGLCTG